MSNSLENPVVVDKLPEPTGRRGAKSMYLNSEATMLALKNKDKWIHCYSFVSKNSNERRNKASAMRLAGNNFVNKYNNTVYRKWQFKVVTVDEAVNLYLMCCDERTDWHKNNEMEARFIQQGYAKSKEYYENLEANYDNMKSQYE